MNKCKSCGSYSLDNLLFRENVPVFQNMKYKDKIEAVNAKCGNLDIKICNICGMAHNFAFDSSLVDYAESYENSQFCSGEYVNYINEIIDILINKYEIKNTNIVEIGCGNGKFLSILAKESKSKGFGFDPSFSKDSNMGGGRSRNRNKTRVLHFTKIDKSWTYCM
ncbi:hypothetical protein [Helicobacter sp. MIT 99-5507]|uniref:hypothetical protein n=1 Tax=Helicobacter sp. MIT 99-5507 TaxID=152489 RepID=UPI0015F132EE|nr:hypothetical protein [Helicobacter sp. MIT 99-5507]